MNYVVGKDASAVRGRSLTTPSRCHFPSPRRRIGTESGIRTSGEQRLAHPAAAGRARRHGEDRRADVLDVLVQRVVPARLRCTVMNCSRVALERQEEQPGVEAAELVVAVDEVVAAAQQAWRRRCCRGARGARARPRRCAASRRRRASLEVGLGELGAARQRRALALVAADDALLLLEPRAVPASRSPCGSCARRGSVPPAIQAGPSAVGRPDVLGDAHRGSSALMLAVPSLKPNRLRGVACAVEVDEVRPKPSCDQRIAARPNAMRLRLRIACTATCGSSAQAWMQRSPPDALGHERVAEKRGSGSSSGRRRRCRERRSGRRTASGRSRT